MDKCKSCGAEIIWIKMKGTGKAMPVDATPISYTHVEHPLCDALTLITPEGKVCKATFDPGGEKIGYTSHFATCPNAQMHRKMRKCAGRNERVIEAGTILWEMIGKRRDKQITWYARPRCVEEVTEYM